MIDLGLNVDMRRHGAIDSILISSTMLSRLDYCEAVY